MPAKSKAQREVMAIAEHHPEDLYARNAGLKKMSKGQLHDFASTPERGLQMRIMRRHRAERKGK
jgi:hypothetical protein